MRIDWENVKYQVGLIRDDLRYNAQARKRLAIASAGALVLLVGFVFYLSLPGGKSEPAPAGAARAFPAPPVTTSTPSYRGAKDFAEQLARKLASDQRFTGIAVVPSVSGPDGRAGRVMLMGQLARADLDALRGLVGQLNPPVAIDWQVTYP